MRINVYRTIFAAAIVILIALTSCSETKVRNTLSKQDCSDVSVIIDNFNYFQNYKIKELKFEDKYLNMKIEMLDSFYYNPAAELEVLLFTIRKFRNCDTSAIKAVNANFYIPNLLPRTNRFSLNKTAHLDTLFSRRDSIYFSIIKKMAETVHYTDMFSALSFDLKRTLYKDQKNYFSEDVSLFFSKYVSDIKSKNKTAETFKVIDDLIRSCEMRIKINPNHEIHVKYLDFLIFLKSIQPK